MKESILRAFEDKYLEKYPDKKANDYAYYHIRKMVEDALHEGLVIDSKKEIDLNRSSLNTPLLALMHDTAHDLQDLKFHTDKIGKWLKENNISDTEPWVRIEYLKSATKNITDKQDEFYIKYKELTPATTS